MKIQNNYKVCNCPKESNLSSKNSFSNKKQSDSCICCPICPTGPQGPTGATGPQGIPGGVLSYADYMH